MAVAQFTVAARPVLPVFVRVKVNGVVGLGVVVVPSLSVRSLIAMVGAVSSFVIVPRPWPSRIVAFVSPDRLTKNVSLSSYFVSPLTSTWTCCVVMPGEKVSSVLLTPV